MVVFLRVWKDASSPSEVAVADQATVDVPGCVVKIDAAAARFGRDPLEEISEKMHRLGEGTPPTGSIDSPRL